MPPLKALLDIPSLELSLHCGDAESLFTAVKRLDAPVGRSWLGPGDLRLTETPYSTPRPEPDPLFASGPCAVGYALTPKERHLPPKLLEAAQRQGVALFTVPPTVNPSRVREAALRLLAEESLPGLQASAELQQYLLESLDSAKPERELLERLHVLSGGSFVLLSPWNTLLARSGPAGWKGPQVLPGSLREGLYQIDGKPALALRVDEGGRLVAALFALDADISWRPLLELTRGILRLAARERRAETERDAALRGALLNEWLSGASDPAELLPRLEGVGLEPQSSYVVAICEPGERSRPNRQRRLITALKEAGDAFFETLGLPVLSGGREDHCLWVFNSTEAGAHLSALVKALQATALTFRLGLSLPRRDHRGVSTAYRQALLAAQTVSEAQGGRTFSSLDPISWVLEQQPQANLRALHDQLVGPVQAADESGKLWRTLIAYLRTPSDMSGLAERLHIHVNTLRYRLGRIEALIGQPLSQPETLARLYLAEQIDGMLGRSIEPDLP